MKESAIQKKIKESHEKRGWIVIKLIQTTMNGVPDLLLIKRGKCVFVEVKGGSNKSTPLQRYQQKVISEQGIDVFETNNPDFSL